MECKKVLYVGLDDNRLSIVFKILFRDWEENAMTVQSVGIGEHADKGFPPSESVIKIAHNFDRVVTPYDPPNPKLLDYAKANDLKVLYHQPRPMSELQEKSSFDMIVTPYLSVYKELLGRDLDAAKVRLICSPSGIDPKTSTRDACLQMKKWIETTF